MQNATGLAWWDSKSQDATIWVGFSVQVGKMLTCPRIHFLLHFVITIQHKWSMLVWRVAVMIVRQMARMGESTESGPLSYAGQNELVML